MSTPNKSKKTKKSVNSATSKEITLKKSDLSRVLPRQISTGNQRGTQNITGEITVTNPITGDVDIAIDGTSGTINVGAGAVIIDGPNNAITVTNDDGSVVGMGQIPGSTDFGFYAQDLNGNLLYKIVGSTIYTYDITQDPVTNNMQLLKLPDATYGIAVAKPGDNIPDAFS